MMGKKAFIFLLVAVVAALVAGKTVTGFTDSEEEAVAKTDIVPYLIESKFKEQGRLFASYCIGLHRMAAFHHLSFSR